MAYADTIYRACYNQIPDKELGDAEKIYQADYKFLSGISGLSARQRESIIRNHSLGKSEKDHG